MEDTTVAPCGYTKAEIMAILGIKPRSNRKIVLPQEVVELLGKRTDRELALLAGVNSVAIMRWRDRLGIPAYRLLTPEVRQLLGTMPDDVLAKHVGRKTSFIARMRRRFRIRACRPKRIRPSTAIKLTELLPLLGTIPDSEIAVRSGLHKNTVMRWRKLQGIPLYYRRPVMSQEVKKLLGTMPEAELAKKVGVTISYVCQLRKKLGIPKYSKTKSEG